MSIYDPRIWEEKTPANVLGGQNRSKTAKRLQGKFLPNDELLASLIQPNPFHGRAGGLKVLEKYGRKYFRELASKRRKS